MNDRALGARSREPRLEPGVVVIGASLGGFDAVRLLLGGLPASFPAPIVLVQHRMSDPDGLLVELLGVESLLPVSEPEDKDPIVPGHVYLAPSDYHLLLERGFFSLSTEAPVCHARPSIDVLFQSAADSYGPSAVAVLLTGSNRDGASGARAVKNAGGRVLVQDPRTALSPVAPEAAMECTVVDSVLALPRIAERLASMFAPTGGAAV
jgi:two-component system chemotaxis response regulator CheB